MLGDSSAIVRYLDAAYSAGRPLWPTDAEALRISLEIAALVDSALNTLVDVGTRFYALREHAGWSKVRNELVGRAQASLDALGARVAALGPRPVTNEGWGAADIWLYTAVAAVAGVWFLTMAHQLYAGVRRGEPVKPLRLFLQSNNYLAMVFCALALDSALALPTLLHV